MKLSELKNKICDCFAGSPEELENFLQTIDDNRPVFPFNEFEYLICNLIQINKLTFEQYKEIRTEYINENPNLWIFEIFAPSDFGNKFAQKYVMGQCSELQTPSKKLDPDYSGQYDMLLGDIKIEVKASRAVEMNSDEPFYIKALSRDTDKRFEMNFQQLKPQYCDVFIWVAVFRDEIVIWVMNSTEVSNNLLYSKGQHRDNHDNEGQLHIKHNNICNFDEYELKGKDLGQLIKEAAKRS